MTGRALNIFASALIALSAFFLVSVLCLAEKDELNQFVSQTATVSKLSGKVEILRKDEAVWQEAKQGMQLCEGDKIRTEEEAKAELALQDGSFIRLKQKSTLGLNAAREEVSSEATEYELDFRVGQIMLELKKLKAGSSFKVETPTAVAAVRGTIFYMATGTREVDGQQQPFTDLYVDTEDIINFFNTLSGESYDVRQGEGSSCYGDGTMDEPEPLSPSAQDAWKGGWDIGDGGDSGSKKGMRDVDEEGADDLGDDVDDTTDSQNDALEGALEEQKDEQDTSKQDPKGPDEPGEPPEPDYDGDGIPDVEDAFREDPHIDPDSTFTNIAGDTVIVKGYGSRDELRQAGIDNLLAIAGLRQDIYDMLEDIQVRQFEAVKEEIFDHQVAKVMTDRWNNRVRVETYISQPTADQVQILSLNLRTGGPNAGISSLDFRATFDDLSNVTDLKSLPWGDYMDNPLVKDTPGIPSHGQPFAQLILYENDDGEYYDPTLPQPGYPNGYPLPEAFSLEVRNPYADSVKFTETYSGIDVYNLPTPGALQLWAQIQTGEQIGINGTQFAGSAWHPVDDWGTGWNGENRFIFLNYFSDEAWLIGAFYLIDDNGIPVQGVNEDYLHSGKLDIHGIRDCINPDYNLEMVFFSSEFAGVDPDLPEIIAAEETVNDAYERYLYNTYRTIDVITIPELTEPYRD